RADDVHLRLLRGQRDPGRLRVEAHQPRARVLRAVALAHRARPDAARGAVLRDLLEKNERRGAKSSTSSPRSIAHSTYVNPSARVNASSCAAVEPASRMW